MTRRQIEWSNFSMQPISPLTAPNPVTRILNMSMSSDGSWRRRKSFGSGPSAGGGIQNHIVADVGGTTYLVVKTGTSLRAYDGTSWTTLAGFVDSDDPPVGGASVSSTERGSFAVHGGELYYADTTNILAWDGDGAAVRRPGVKSLDSHVYWNSSTPPGFNLARIDSSPVNDPSDYNTVTDGEVENPTSAGINPRIAPQDGEKHLNTGFCFSVYDPKRDIYGRRSEVFSLPYVFGPPAEEDLILTDERWQYAKEISTPGDTFIPDDHKVAVWFTLGMHILTNVLSSVQSGWITVPNVTSPTMSERMTGVVFLEGIFEPDESAALCKKDNAALYRSGQYTDKYARPVPCQLMVILNNGVAIYFSPRTHEDGATDENSEFGNFVEFSERHPEQIGRNTENDDDTRGPYPILRGTPIVPIVDGNRTLIMTRQAVYQVGFDGTGPVLSEMMAGRGVRAVNSITRGSLGLSWMSDAGVVLIGGQSGVLIDRRIGFGDWFRDLSTSQKSDVAIGFAEDESQMLAFAPIPGGSGRRAFAYDFEQNVVSEFRTTTIPQKCIYFPDDDNSRLILFTSSGSSVVYPSSSSESFDSMMEFWISENPDIPKTMQDIHLDLGPNNGTLEVSVEAFDSYEDVGPLTTTTETFTVSSDTGHRRIRLETWTGIRGKLFRCRISASGSSPSEWSVSRMFAEVILDDQPMVKGV